VKCHRDLVWCSRGPLGGFDRQGETDKTWYSIVVMGRGFVLLRGELSRKVQLIIEEWSVYVYSAVIRHLKHDIICDWIVHSSVSSAPLALLKCTSGIFLAHNPIHCISLTPCIPLCLV
jgi:hypothetical protein